jgi:predicted nucleic acid-binding protein
MKSTKPVRVFVDSDVIISSLISASGAAYALLHDTEQVELFISNFSIAELEKVISRLKLKIEGLQALTATSLNIVSVSQSYEKVQQQFAYYVHDADDAHIVAGAKEAGSIFLVSYNIRHFES